MRSPTRARPSAPARCQRVTLWRLLLLGLTLIVSALVLGPSAPALPPPGLVAAYGFDEGAGGAATDASGNGHFGTINGATWTTSGRFGGALSFNGTNASVDLGGLGTFYRTSFTLEAWVQKETTKNDVAVLGSWTANESGGPMIWVDHLATHYQLTMNQGLSNYLDSGRNPVAGVWQHLAVTFDGTTARFYIDGTEVANRTVTVGIGGSNAWRVGAYGSTPGGFFDGLIDEVRVYNRALSVGEVQTDMGQPVSTLTAPDTTPPSAPGTLTATGGPAQVSLNWGAATDDVAVTKYDVYRSTTPGFTPDASNRIAQPSGTSYTDSGLGVGTYYYRVAAEDAAGNVGPSSNQASAAAGDGFAPSAPTGVTASASGTNVTVSWLPSTDNVGVTRYNVHRGTTSAFTPTAANRIAQPTASPYTDAGLLPGTYYYKLTAEDAAGNVSGASIAASAVIPDTTAPTTPGSLTATLAGSSVNLTWTGSSDNVAVARYNVHRGTTSGFAPTSGNRIAQPTGTTYTDTPPSAGTYYYKVTAEDAAGNVSGASNEAVVTILDATPPTAPSNLAAVVAGSTVSLSWTASTDNVGVIRYNVHRGTSAGFSPTSGNRIGQPAGTSFSNTGVAPGTYFYKVTAEDAAGNVSVASNEAPATVASTDTTPPVVTVTAPAAGATVSDTVTVSANASDNVGVAGVQFKVDGQNIGAEDTSAPYAASWDTRSQLNGSHTLTAVARDGAGNTTASGPVAVTVDNAPGSPAGLKAAYALDEGTGTSALDTSGNYNTATLLGAGWTTGYYGGAASLSGASAEIDPPALGTFYKTGFTFEAWVFKQSTKLDVGIVGSWTGGQGGAMLWIDHLSGNYRLALGTNLAGYVDSGRTPTVGAWQFIAGTYDGTTARIYVDGVQAASATFPAASIGNSNTWRLGAYGSPAGGFFDGRIDNVRIYDRALSPSEIQTDMTSRIQPDTTPPAVSAFTPAPGATGVNFGTSATAKFNEPMKSTTITSSTFQLRDSSGNLVPATVTYNATTNIATLNPQTALQFGTTYTLTVKGGTGGAADLAGNPLATDATSSFTTQDRATPILVVTSTSNPFASYLTELLRNEGLNEFTTIDISLLSTSALSGFDIVLLGDVAVTPAQATTLTSWVNGGGNLIAMRPDKDLASLLGLTSVNGTLANAYLKIDTSAGPGAGIVGSTIQYHGTADRYSLAGATAVATLYSNASTATTYPAVALRSVGSSGGQAAAFTYDLARSVVLTRQGNPAWAGQERDGASGIRPDDMFYSSWLDTNKISIPQADEQQRLLVNMITLMERDRLPLPHFWYLPRGLKAVVVMSGDDHSPTNVIGGTASIFDRFKQLSPPGCVVAKWECVRATSYVYPNSTLTNQQATGYVADGFEVALHPVVDSCPTATMTQSQLSTYFDTQLGQFASNFAGVPAPVTSRTHCVYWPDWASSAKIELAHGIRLDGNYYHYPGAWIGSKPGFLNGGGFPMRFADNDGTSIDVYQANTNMTDESGQQYPATVNTLLDNALGPLAYYGAFGTNIHTDYPAPNPNDEAIVASAQSRGVPVISYKQLLDWVDGRNESTIRNPSWNGGTLTFDVSAGSGASGLQAMLPRQGPAGTLSSLTSSGAAVPYTIQTIKGIEYAMFAAATGTYQATYS